MAFKPFNIIKNGIKSTFNLNQWIGTDILEEGTKSILSIIRLSFKKNKTKPIKKHNFKDFIENSKISDRELTRKAKHFIYHFYIYICFMVLGLFYVIFLFDRGKIFFSLLTISILGLALYKCYRSYSYYYQIKHRRFGP